MRRTYAILVSALALLAFGCSSLKHGNVISSGSGGAGGQLYISTPSSILRYSNAETLIGDVAPTATITNPAISAPRHLLVDTSADRLYVANQGGSSILIFDNASKLTGNIPPTRVIAGNATKLVAPIDVALDTTNNLLYVADGTSILVFSSISTINGNVPPVRNINMGISIGGLLLDATNNQLYVSDPGDDAVDRLDGASTQDVVGIVGGAIAGPDTKLAQPRGLALDAAGRLMVGNSAIPTSITVYPNASTATGDVIPVADITGGNTRLQSPQQLALNRNVSNGELYVADPLAAAILIFTNMSTLTGNVAPARVISGPNTELTASAINGLALDPTH